jgi:hypothetical protein
MFPFQVLSLFTFVQELISRRKIPWLNDDVQVLVVQPSRCLVPGVYNGSQYYAIRAIFLFVSDSLLCKERQRSLHNSLLESKRRDRVHAAHESFGFSETYWVFCWGGENELL